MINLVSDIGVGDVVIVNNKLATQINSRSQMTRIRDFQHLNWALEFRQAKLGTVSNKSNSRHKPINQEH